MASAAQAGNDTVAIIGAGLAGIMLAMQLASRRDGGKPYKIILVERRADFRKEVLQTEKTE